MIEVWRWRGESGMAIFVAVFAIQCLNSCFSLNDEGLALLRFKERVVSDPFEALSGWNDAVGVSNPCSWSGIKCADGNVVILNLKDLCLGGTLGTDLGSLVHIKLIILRNNSFYGIIPDMFQELEELEVLDLGYNDFSTSLPSALANNMPLPKGVVLLDNNDLCSCISPEIKKLKLVSEARANESQPPDSSQRNINQAGDLARRSLVGDPGDDPPVIPFPFPDEPPPPPPTAPLPPTASESPSPSATPSPAPSPVSESDFPASPAPSSPPPFHLVHVPSQAKRPSVAAKSSSSNHHRKVVLSLAVGVPVLFCSLMIGLFFCQRKKVAAMGPWVTGLSGQLQRSLVTAGVPMLKRSELEAACEDFSNVIASSPSGTIYKGTLSSGVEIAVTSVAVASAKDWSNSQEAQFRNKIDLLSKVNHKNFVNLLGYCKEAEPFSRMLVFEYAPNGTLFEHLHIKEAEHLDWGTRMRITMGTAYCLEHMHHLSPPIAHKSLTSSAINLSEDYAAKVSDFIFTSDAAAAPPQTGPTLETNIYSFGVLLFEVVTGKIPYSVERGNPDDWASHYLRGQRPLSEMVDPTLRGFDAEQLERISQVVVSCVRPDPKQRPGMREVTTRLREIIGIGPDGAVPKISPLWWAELEILSTEGS